MKYRRIAGGRIARDAEGSGSGVVRDSGRGGGKRAHFGGDAAEVFGSHLVGGEGDIVEFYFIDSAIKTIHIYRVPRTNIEIPWCIFRRDFSSFGIRPFEFSIQIQTNSRTIVEQNSMIPSIVRNYCITTHKT